METSTEQSISTWTAVQAKATERGGIETAIEKFIASGGEIKVIPPGVRSGYRQPLTSLAITERERLNRGLQSSLSWNRDMRARIDKIWQRHPSLGKADIAKKLDEDGLKAFKGGQLHYHSVVRILNVTGDNNESSR